MGVGCGGGGRVVVVVNGVTVYTGHNSRVVVFHPKATWARYFLLLRSSELLNLILNNVCV